MLNLSTNSYLSERVVALLRNSLHLKALDQRSWISHDSSSVFSENLKIFLSWSIRPMRGLANLTGTSETLSSLSHFVPKRIIAADAVRSAALNVRHMNAV